MTDEEFNEHYFQLVSGAYESKKISKTVYENLIDRYGNNLDEIERNYNDFIHAMTHGEYYITLDRITRGEELLAAETDELKKSEYRKLLFELTAKLERLTPKEDAA